MKRKIVSVLLALVLTLVLLPAGVLADDATWTTIGNSSLNVEGAMALSESGKSYKLGEDVDCALIRFSADSTLDLNGFQLKQNGTTTSTTCFIHIIDHVTLTLIDSSKGKTGKIISDETTPVLGISSGGKLYAHGVTIIGNVTNYGQIFGGTFEGKINGSAPHVTGSGTEADPYKIYTAEGLKWFRDIVNGENGQTKKLDAWAVLENDIKLDSSEAWTPIGNTANVNGTDAYSGTFDGNGHTISGLNVTGELKNAGLFGVVKDGTIKNLTVAGKVSPSIIQCGAGGIVGRASDAAKIENCSNHCSVTGRNSSIIGGISGYNVDGAKIIDCYNVGTISGTFAQGAGGIAGHNSGTISNCYNVGTVSGDFVGEIVGNNFDTVENCYYLDGAELKAVGKNFTNGNITKTESKSAAQFADGTVRDLLYAGRDYANQPWDDTCRFVTEAGKYLPVFKYQNSYEPAPTPEPVSEPSGSRFSYSTISASAGENGTVSPSGNLSVRDDLSQTFVFTPDKGYRVKDVLIDGQSVGALRSYTFATVRKNRTVEVIFEKIPAFVDVPAGSYYEDAVNWAVENWITEGTDDTHFSPDSPCTRAQAVTFLWRAAGCPAPSSYTMPFADVKSGSYYETAVLWALENNIVSGTSETTFEPDAVCTRAQIVCFLFRYKAANGMDAVTLAELLGGYTDSAEIPAYASPALNWALSANVLQGSGAKLLPNEACTRAQIVTFLYRTIR